MRLAMRLKDWKDEVKAEGKSEEQLATAERMLAAGGLSAEFISRMTTLSLADIQKLQAEMQAAH